MLDNQFQSDFTSRSGRLLQYFGMGLEYILGILSLIYTVQSSHKLYIISPPQLAQRFNSSVITIHSTSLGYTPKGSNINGVIRVSNPLNACSLIQESDLGDGMHQFYLANSQGCSASTKASNIFKANGYAAIIIKDQQTVIEKHGSKVSMPVLEISSQDAQVLIQFILMNPTQTVLSSIHFASRAPDKTKEGAIRVDLWMSSSNVDAYNFLQQFRGFYNTQPKQIFFQPRFVLDSKGLNKTTYHVGCLSSGKYCAPELELHSRMQGKQVVEQDLRQLIIWRLAPLLWWNYATNWKIDCLSKDNIFTQSGLTERCSNSSMVKAGVDPEVVKKQFLGSFRGPKIEIQDNQYLMGQLSDQKESKVKTWPSVYINFQQFKQGKSSLSNSLYNIQATICEGQSPNYSDTCKQLSPRYSSDDNQEFWIITLVVGSLVLLMLILLLVYNFVMKRRMKGQVQEEVDRVLEQYYTYSGATRLQDM